jgi:three-Cys-motif partner protein
MAKGFHDKEFDEGTRLKLEIFKGYVREWLPVFLSKPSYPSVNILDFFAGPGTDAARQPGSPLIFLEEVRQYLTDPKHQKAAGVQVTLYFNDIDPSSVESLREHVRSFEPLPCKVRFESLGFEDAFEKELPLLRRHDTANLVILDQCGLKQVHEHVFRELVACPTTDLLFFISSSHIRRFITEEPIQKYFPLPEDEIGAIKKIRAEEIHRYVCRSFYQKLITLSQEYYVAPFSIQKENRTTIYGLIFGSSSLYGLEKFLRVCWDKDRVTGEANYNIDRDSIRDGQLSLFPDRNVIKKQDRFQQGLLNLLRAQTCTNKTLYRYALENGFLPKHVTDLLKRLQDEGVLEVREHATGRPARKGAFYVRWDSYREAKDRVIFVYTRNK